MAEQSPEQKKAIEDLERSTTAQNIFEKGRAGYPALYLITQEDNLAQRDIKIASRALGRRLFIWTEGVGLVEDKPKSKPIEDTMFPQQALAWLGNLTNEPKDHGIVVILRLFHHSMSGMSDSPAIQAKILDIVPNMKVTKRMLIVTAPYVKLPPEVEKEFALIESKLPTAAQLRETLDGIITGTGLKGDKIPSEDKKKHLIESAMGLTTVEAENALTLSAVRPSIRKELSNIWDPKIVLEEKCQALKKTGLLEYIPAPTDGMKQIGGLENLKTWIRKRKAAFSEKAKAFGLPPPRGLLLVGPPGTGKSLTAKAISGELDLPLLRMDMGKMYGSLVGQSEANVRQAIQVAEALAPCVVWIDEIEKGISGANAGSLDSGVGARVLGTLLTWMQEKTAPVIVYATANDVTRMPPELLRKGRFDEIFFVDLPSEEERAEIFAIHMTRLGRAKLLQDKIDLKGLVDASENYSGSEIKAAIEDALATAFYADRELSEEDIKEALESTQPLFKTMKEVIEATRRWCESRARPANTRSIKDNLTKVGQTGRTVQV
jgi:SpoVK/Ycf46/Vps4 family AAA+-type ATPase